jgi:hypothetical protein
MPNSDPASHLYATLAFEAMLDGNSERAEEWLRKLPRVMRGKITIACDDLTMLVSRLGNH